MIKRTLWLLVNACETPLIVAEGHIAQYWHLEVRIDFLFLFFRHFWVAFLIEIEATECFHIRVNRLLVFLLLK